jgi:cation diffusion facilitator CzcD-associated flavoprotein CzcO
MSEVWQIQVKCKLWIKLLTLSRFTPGDGFLEALVAPNATVITEEIECVTPLGIKTVDGVEHAVDVIVCATGFDVSQRPAFPVIGRNNLDLRDFWEKEPINYLSVTAPGFPNYFSKHSLPATMVKVLTVF